METRTFQAKLKALISQRNVLALGVIALSLAVIQLSFAVRNKEERVVVIPTTGPSFWVEKSRASQQYLQVIGVFLSDLLLTRTPADISWKNDQVLGHAHPRFYNALKKALSEEKETLLQAQSSFVFETTRSYPLENSLQFVVEGNQKTYVAKTGGGGSLVQSQKIKYILSFCCEEGRLYLNHISQEKI